MTPTGLWPYAGVFIAAIVEGEAAYVAAAAFVAQGQLNPWGVIVAGALGAAIGDQAFFYMFRGRIASWMARLPAVARTAAPLLGRVRRHQTLMVLLIRFAPGLRIAIAAACAWVDVRPALFSGLNLLSAFVWAGALLGLVGWFGPTYLARFGFDGWKGAVLVGLVILGAFKALGAYERRTLERHDPAEAGGL